MGITPDAILLIVIELSFIWLVPTELAVIFDDVIAFDAILDSVMTPFPIVGFG